MYVVCARTLRAGGILMDREEKKSILGAIINCSSFTIFAITSAYGSWLIFVTLEWPWYFLGFVFIPLLGTFILCMGDEVRKIYRLLAKKRVVQ